MRPSRLFSTLGGSILYPRSSKLHVNNIQHKKKHKTLTNPTICMISCYHSPITTGRSNHRTTNWSYNNNSIIIIIIIIIILLGTVFAL